MTHEQTGFNLDRKPRTRRGAQGLSALSPLDRSLQKMNLSNELVRAAHDGNVGEIRRLRDMGHELNLQCDDGSDLLYHFIWQNNADPPGTKLQELLALGVLPRNQNTAGGTPLVPAIWSHCSEWVHILLEAGADPNVIAFLGDDESTALDTVLDDYCDCDTDEEIEEMKKIELMIRQAGGRVHRLTDPKANITADSTR